MQCALAVKLGIHALNWLRLLFLTSLFTSREIAFSSPLVVNYMFLLMSHELSESMGAKIKLQKNGPRLEH